MFPSGNNKLDKKLVISLKAPIPMRCFCFKVRKKLIASSIETRACKSFSTALLVSSMLMLSSLTLALPLLLLVSMLLASLLLSSMLLALLVAAVFHVAVIAAAAPTPASEGTPYGVHRIRKSLEVP